MRAVAPSAEGHSCVPVLKLLVVSSKSIQESAAGCNSHYETHSMSPVNHIET
jgi:hypothetical protein